MAATRGGAGQRVLFIDLLRLLAAFQMVHGHTLDALMADELRHGVAFERWSWGRGLVSVAFLVGAGLSYHLSTLARFDQHRASRDAVLGRFRRAGLLLALGYLLHLPVGVLLGGEAAAAALRELAMVDVLQCIGVCLFTLELLTVLARRPQHVAGLSAVLAAAAFALAPLTDAIDPAGPWRPVLSFLTARGGSLFPLFPWAGYVFAGVAVGALVLPEGSRTPRGSAAVRLAVCAAVALGAAMLADAAPLSLATAETGRASQPSFILLKLGAVLGLAAGLALLSQRVGRLPRVAEILAGESLVIYVVHLLVVYGAGVGLRSLVGPTLPLPAALGVALALVVSMAFVGLGWNRWKAWRASRREALARPGRAPGS